MKFYKAINNNQVINYEESEISVNDFANNKITSGIARIDDDIFITEQVLTNILNGDDHYKGIRYMISSSQYPSCSSSTEVIQANFNEIFIKSGSGVLNRPPDINEFCYPKTIEILDVMYWDSKAEFKEQTCKSVFVVKNKLSEKTLFLCKKLTYPDYDRSGPIEPHSKWNR